MSTTGLDPSAKVQQSELDSVIDSINNGSHRLREFGSRLSNITDRLKGPNPEGADPGIDAASSECVMGRLHQSVDGLHSVISILEEELGRFDGVI